MIKRLIFILLILIVAVTGCGRAPLDPSGQSGSDRSPLPDASAESKAGKPSQGQDQLPPRSGETPHETAFVSPIPNAAEGTEATSEQAKAPPNPVETKGPEATSGQDSESSTPSAMDQSITAPEPPAPSQEAGDLSLSGKTIVLDPGHQSVVKQELIPIGPGATETRQDYAIGTRGVASGVYEYEVVLIVAKKLQKVLQDKGATVILTRESHDVLVSNRERARMANDAKADAFIRIHCDGSDSPKARGISVLYPGDAYIKDQEVLKNSKELSHAILESLAAETQANNRGLVKRNDLVGFNYCTVPCTLVEMGFMTNPEEDRLLNSGDYQDKLVAGIAEGIMDYLDSKQDSSSEIN